MIVRNPNSVIFLNASSSLSSSILEFLSQQTYSIDKTVKLRNKELFLKCVAKSTI